MSGSPRWLTDEQQQVWRLYLQGTDRIEKFLDAWLRPHGLDLAEYEILVSLSEADGQRLRMSDLAAQAHQSRSRLTHTVSRLEERGLISRTKSPTDGRGVIAALTPAGLKLLETAAPEHVDSVRQIFIDVVPAEDYAAIGRAMRAVLDVDVESTLAN